MIAARVFHKLAQVERRSFFDEYERVCPCTTYALYFSLYDIFWIILWSFQYAVRCFWNNSDFLFLQIHIVVCCYWLENKCPKSVAICVQVCSMKNILKVSKQQHALHALLILRGLTSFDFFQLEVVLICVRNLTKSQSFKENQWSEDFLTSIFSKNITCYLIWLLTAFW